jgi:hypothetical protein
MKVTESYSAGYAPQSSRGQAVARLMGGVWLVFQQDYGKNGKDY